MTGLLDKHIAKVNSAPIKVLTLTPSKCCAGASQDSEGAPAWFRHSFHSLGRALNLVQRRVAHARMETTAIYLQALGAEGREITARMWT
jgi:site-specific recombinase XerD